MEFRPYQHFVHIEKRTEKKNGSSDLVDLGTFRLIRRSSEESTWSGIPLALQGNSSVCVYQGMCNSCFLIWKRGTTTCKFSAWKVTIKEMEYKFGYNERVKSSVVTCKQTQAAKSKVDECC